MSRTPSLTVAEAEAALGRGRGHLYVNSDNIGIARKWLTAKGLSGAFAATLRQVDVAVAYNDATDEKFRALQVREAQWAANNQAIVATPNTATVVAPSNDSQVQRIAALLGELLSKPAIDADAVNALIDQRWESLPDLIAKYSPVTKIEITRQDSSTHTVEGIVHPMFKTLLRVATTRDANGYVPNIFLAGEMSSGKTTGCKMLADALGVPHFLNGAISMSHEMLGFRDAAGNYHSVPFSDAFSVPSVYTFDEVDRSDNAALLAVNPHLANGRGSFPHGMIKRHPDCIITATANTWGLGGDADYVGAAKLDAAFMSRFPTRLPWNIDESFERAVSGNVDWACRVQKARSNARRAGIKVGICMRMTLAGAGHIANGFTMQEAAEMTYLANLTADQKRIIEAE